MLVSPGWKERAQTMLATLTLTRTTCTLLVFVIAIEIALWIYIIIYDTMSRLITCAEMFFFYFCNSLTHWERLAFLVDCSVGVSNVMEEQKNFQNWCLMVFPKQRARKTKNNDVTRWQNNENPPSLLRTKREDYPYGYRTHDDLYRIVSIALLKRKK